MLLQVEAAAQDIEVNLSVLSFLIQYFCRGLFIFLIVVNQPSNHFFAPEVDTDSDLSHQIMSQFESSTATLKTILSHPSLQRDAIDATMDAMSDANAEAQSVDDAIRNGLEASQAEGYAEIDDDEIQKELEALVDEAQKEDRAQKSAVLGDVERGVAPGRVEVSEDKVAEKDEACTALEDEGRNGRVVGESDRSVEQLQIPDAPTNLLKASDVAGSKELAQRAQIETN